MCTVHDDIPELARLSRLRKSQIKGLLVASSTVKPCATRVQARARRHRIEAPWLAIPLRPLAALGQEQESGGTSGQARSGGGLVEMIRRIRCKSETVRLTYLRFFKIRAGAELM